MGKVGFDKDFHQLESVSEHDTLKDLHGQMAIVGLLSRVPWLLSMLASFPSLIGSYGAFFDYVPKQVEEKKKVSLFAW